MPGGEGVVNSPRLARHLGYDAVEWGAQLLPRKRGARHRNAGPRVRDLGPSSGARGELRAPLRHRLVQRLGADEALFA